MTSTGNYRVSGRFAFVSWAALLDKSGLERLEDGLPARNGYPCHLGALDVFSPAGLLKTVMGYQVVGITTK